MVRLERIYPWVGKLPLVVNWFPKNFLYDLSKLEASKRNVLNPNLTKQAFKRIKLFPFS